MHKIYKEEYNKITSLTSELNHFWEINCTRNKKTIENSQSAEELINSISVNFDFTIDGIAIKYLDEILPAIDLLIKQHPEVVYSPISKYINTIVVKNDLSVNHCQTNIMRHRLNNHTDLSKCNSVLEIGAGYGAFAREILLCNNNMKYVIIDLPETVICSYVFLSLEFPDKKHVIMNNLDQVDHDFDILYVPTGALENFKNSGVFKQYDLFVNTCSMGEMNNIVIKYYYDLVTNVLDIKSVYWLNRFLNKPHDPIRKNQNMCMATIPTKWHIKHWERTPMFLRCPYIISFHAKMVEIYANIENFDDNLESNETNNEVLFHLWNTNRLNPTFENNIKLIRQIRSLAPSAEELWYYERIYELK